MSKDTRIRVCWFLFLTTVEMQLQQESMKEATEQRPIMPRKRAKIFSTSHLCDHDACNPNNNLSKRNSEMKFAYYIFFSTAPYSFPFIYTHDDILAVWI